MSAARRQQVPSSPSPATSRTAAARRSSSTPVVEPLTGFDELDLRAVCECAWQQWGVDSGADYRPMDLALALMQRGVVLERQPRIAQVAWMWATLHPDQLAHDSAGEDPLADDEPGVFAAPTSGRVRPPSPRGQAPTPPAVQDDDDEEDNEDEREHPHDDDHVDYDDS